ncbi:unnamed protein product [Ilex paraguariensis]|uniref:Uncharacterized protein n=1 Tax=Ilex paraguariensis TaxID=185542 RepID=A0ABC8QMI7_9AQUA
MASLRIPSILRRIDEYQGAILLITLFPSVTFALEIVGNVFSVVRLNGLLGMSHSLLYFFENGKNVSLGLLKNGFCYFIFSQSISFPFLILREHRVCKSEVP